MTEHGALQIAEYIARIRELEARVEELEAFLRHILLAQHHGEIGPETIEEALDLAAREKEGDGRKSGERGA